MADGVTAAELAKRIDQILEVPTLPKLSAIYFDRERTPSFAGATFDLLGENPNKRFVVADLLTLNLLDEKVGPSAMRRILSGEVNSALAAVPPKTKLWNSSAKVRIAMNSLREQLRTMPGIGPTKAAKLCARKRPDLMPIYDSVVDRVLLIHQGPWWDALASALTDESRRDRIQALDPHITDYTPSVLRLLDVAVWMVGSNARTARDARREADLTADPLW